MRNGEVMSRPSPDGGDGEWMRHFRERVDEFKRLDLGWHGDGNGMVFDPQSLDRLTGLYAEFYPRDCPEPHVYPSPENAVQLEWDVRRWRISLEIDAGTLKGEFYAIELDTDEDVFRDDLDLSGQEDWQWISQWLLEKFSEGTSRR